MLAIGGRGFSIGHALLAMAACYCLLLFLRAELTMLWGVAAAEAFGLIGGPSLAFSADIIVVLLFDGC